MTTTILRLPAVLRERARSRSAHYLDIQQGLFTHPVQIGLAYLGIEINAARMKPTIRIVAGEIHRVVDAAERELAQSRRHYQRGGLIVTVVTDPGTRETRIQDVTQQSLVRSLAGAALWERYDARAQDWVRTDPPARHAGVLFDSTSYPGAALVQSSTASKQALT